MKGGFGFSFVSIYSALAVSGLSCGCRVSHRRAWASVVVGGSGVRGPWFLAHESSEARELSRVWGLGSLARDEARVLCIARQGLNHWTTRGSPERRLFFKLQLCSGRVPLLSDLRTVSHRLAALSGCSTSASRCLFPLSS